MRFFPGNSVAILAASSPNIKGLFRKKREKMWGLRIGGVRGGAVSSGGRCAVTGYLKGFLWLFLFENNVLFIRFLRIIFVP